MYLSSSLFSIIWGIYLGVELPGHMAILWLIFRGTIKLFSTAATQFYYFISFTYSMPGAYSLGEFTAEHR